MLILLKNDPTLACEHGNLKADASQAILDAQQLRDAMQSRCDALLADAQAQAEEILAAARIQADELLQQAAAQIEQAAVQAEQAEQEGFAAGERRAAQDWHARHAEQAEKVAQNAHGMHEKLADIVSSAVERIVTTEPRAALYQRALKNVQALTRGASSLTLRVCPDDAEQARASLEGMEGGALSVQVAADPGLRPGSCIFESELGVLDASLELQLDALRQAMTRAVHNALNMAAVADQAEYTEEAPVEYAAEYAEVPAEDYTEEIPAEYAEDGTPEAQVAQ